MYNTIDYNTIDLNIKTVNVTRFPKLIMKVSTAKCSGQATIRDNNPLTVNQSQSTFIKQFAPQSERKRLSCVRAAILRLDILSYLN